MDDKFHIMILSAGSLLSQNILDALESRRDRLVITGLDISAGNPRLFRCDKAYKCPRIDAEDFKTFILDIVHKEQPDVILPGRDHDVLALAEMAAQMPDIRRRIISGSADAADMMNDKARSYAFAQKHGLPFAKSFIVSDGTTEDAVRWAKDSGFPVMGKPTHGFGSLGIQVICDHEQLRLFLERNHSGFMLQEIVDFSEERLAGIKSFSEDIRSGIPLFYHIPETHQYAGQAIIGPDGAVGEIFTSINIMVIGRCEKSERYDDPVLISLTRQYAEAMAREGWRGIFNFQCRKSEHGYVGHEMNGRMSGSTSARRWLGYDEVGIAVKTWFDYDIGLAEDTDNLGSGIVYRSLTDYFVSEKDRDAFETGGIWIK